MYAAIQGFGGGGCISITEIIYADMVPLPERGKFQGIVATYVYLAHVVASLEAHAILYVVQRLGTCMVSRICARVTLVY